MTTYSSPNAIAQFIDQITEPIGQRVRPAFVNDLDGNLLLGYSLTAGQRLPLGPGDDPRRQDIPFGSTPTQIREWVGQGVLIEGIFAEKPMDARLPVELVNLVNARVRVGALLDIVFLTSRGAADAVTLLRESGVEYPEEITLVADSGATLYLHGTRQDVRSLTDAERTFLTCIDAQMVSLNNCVRDIVAELGFDAARCPDLYLESKGIAKNVHHRQVLTAYGQLEGSMLDQRIAAAVEAALRALVEAGPRDPNGLPIFKTLDGPATIEVKVASIHKGHGLEAIAAAAAQAASPPTAIVFTGDDVSKGNGSPGTDYFAMVHAPDVAARYGIPIHTIHTLHPVGGAMNSTEPDMRKSVMMLSDQYPAPALDLCIPTPWALLSIIIAAHDTAMRKSVEIG